MRARAGRRLLHPCDSASTMTSLAIPPLQAAPLPDTRLLFLLNLLAVVAVTVFAAAVVILLLRRSYQRRLAEQKLAAMGTTTARILHQIKNPVGSLLLQAELLQAFEREGNAELRREAAEAILGETQRLATMLNELSVWAAGARRTLARVPMPLHELLRQIARQEGRDAELRGVRLELGPLADAVVRLDAYYFRQAIENLIRNAQEALRGQADAWIRIGLERGGARALVRISDNGPGIPPDKLPTIFEPFVSGKGTGMGLGLPIAQEIVQSHGGELRVESAPGRGTTFTVLLPLEGAGPPAQQPQPTGGAA